MGTLRIDREAKRERERKEGEEREKERDDRDSILTTPSQSERTTREFWWSRIACSGAVDRSANGS